MKLLRNNLHRLTHFATHLQTNEQTNKRTLLVGWLLIERTHGRLTRPSTTSQHKMSTFYTFDLSGETTDEEIHTGLWQLSPPASLSSSVEDEDETWDDAFRPEVQEMTPVKKTNAETTTDIPASSRRRTPSSRRYCLRNGRRDSNTDGRQTHTHDTK